MRRFTAASFLILALIVPTALRAACSASPYGSAVTGAGGTDTGAYMSVQSIYLPNNGQAQGVSFYAPVTGTGAVTVGLWNDNGNPATLLATGAGVAGVVGWNYIAFDTPPLYTPGTYWYGAVWAADGQEIAVRSGSAVSIINTTGAIATPNGPVSQVVARVMVCDATATVTPTFTHTTTSTPTNTPTNTPTSTPTNTRTASPTNTPTSTPTSTPTNTPTKTPQFMTSPTPYHASIWDYLSSNSAKVNAQRQLEVVLPGTWTPTITPTPTGTVSWGGTATFTMTPTNVTVQLQNMPVTQTTPGPGNMFPVGGYQSNGTPTGIRVDTSGRVSASISDSGGASVGSNAMTMLNNQPGTARGMYVRALLETTDGVSNTTISASNPLPVTLASNNIVVVQGSQATTLLNSTSNNHNAISYSKQGRDGVVFTKSGVCGPRESASHVYAEALGTTPVTLKTGGDNLYHDLCQLILTNQGTGDGELYIYNGPITHCGVYMTGVDANHASINMVLPEAESLTKTAGWTAVAAAGMTVHISARFNDHP